MWVIFVELFVYVGHSSETVATDHLEGALLFSIERLDILSADDVFGNLTLYDIQTCYCIPIYYGIIHQPRCQSKLSYELGKY